MWIVENLGGSKTKNNGTKRAIFIGRYQPYHIGHIELINQKLKEGVGVLILVRDIEPDSDNPLTTEQTVNIIEKYHKAKGDDVLVMVIPDIESVNFGRGVGYEVNKFTPPETINNISATQVRKSILNGDGVWKDMIDESIQNDVYKLLK